MKIRKSSKTGDKFLEMSDDKPVSTNPEVDNEHHEVIRSFRFC